MSRRPQVFDLDEVTFDDGEVPARAGPPRPPMQDRVAQDRAAQDRAGTERAGTAGRAAAGETPRTRAADPSRSRTSEAAEVDAEPIAPTPEPIARRKRFTFAGVAALGISGLAGLGLSISLWAFVEDLLGRAPALGGVAAALAVLTVVGLGGIAVREALALRRLRNIEALRLRADEAVAADDRAAAKAVCAELIALYEGRPETARGRHALKGHMREIIDGRDLVALAEREVLGPLDRAAIGHVVSASRRVAAVTALSPRALVDVAFVTFAALTMVRKIAEVYGGRPGTLGFIRVVRQAVAHLAVTGGMAAGDTLIGEIVGKGIAAKLSAKLGEGIVNGLMTARLGLAAVDVLRPLPFNGTRRPRVNDIVGEIARIAPKDPA